MTRMEWRRQQAEIRRHPQAATGPRPQPTSFYGPAPGWTVEGPT